MLASSTPSSLATYFATSMSNPENVPSGFFTLRPGWENLTPMMTLPASALVSTCDSPAAAVPAALVAEPAALAALLAALLTAAPALVAVALPLLPQPDT